MPATIHIFLLSLLIALSGCVFAPGQHMSEGSMKKLAADTNDYREDIEIIPINGTLVAQLASHENESPPTGPAESGDIANYRYRIGVFDLVRVIVWDHPELKVESGEQNLDAAKVDTDGNIYFPYVGLIHVAGKTVTEVRDEVTRKLKESAFKDPQVDVRVVGFRSQRVVVSGEVANPTVVPVADYPLYVSDAINAAGGPKPTADLQHVIVSRGGKTMVVDYLALMSEGDESQRLLLQGGDRIYVPDNNLNKVFVIGEVRRPGSQLISKGHLSLAEAISDASGFDDNTSDPSEVYVIRMKRLPSTERPAGKPDEGFADFGNLVVYKLDAKSPEALVLADQFPLQPRDVVYVSVSEIVRWNRLLKNIMPTIQTMYFGTRAYRDINLISKGK